MTSKGYDFYNETFMLIRKDLLSMQLNSMAFWVPISVSLFTIVPGSRICIHRIFIHMF